MLRSAGGTYFNPDEAAAAIRATTPTLGIEQANSEAWLQGKRMLEQAIERRLDFAFETTLGGNTITQLLGRAGATGFAVRVWYVALASPELHLQRVRERVAKGGHDIPEGDVRRRYDQSRENLIRLLPSLDELRVFDNSASADPHRGDAPAPLLILHVRHGRIVDGCPLPRCPDWAKPIVMAALETKRAIRSRTVRTSKRPRRRR